MTPDPRLSPLDRVLIQLLDPGDRDTISGDLLEEKQARARQSGVLAAELWYARQVLSFVPHAAASRLARTPALALVCGFTALCALWLGAMDLRLHHPGYLAQLLIAATILGESLLTLTAIVSATRLFRWLSTLGTAGILFLAAKAFYGVTHNRHFEGYIVLIAATLVLQSILTIVKLRPQSA